MNIEQQVSLLPDLPHLATDLLPAPRRDTLGADAVAHAPRILLLYGSLRPQSYSRKLALEAQRILQHLGADTRVFDPHDLPMLDSVGRDHPKVRQLREWSQWSEGQVWVSPERHGNVTGVFKNQIDWLPLEDGSVRPTQGRTLAVMQVSGGSQSFNVVNALRAQVQAPAEAAEAQLQFLRGKPAQVADGGDAQVGQLLLHHLAHAGDLRHRQRREERLDLRRPHHEHAVGLVPVRGDLGQELVRRHAG